MNPYRSDFPIFDKYPSLAYLDNAATTQRPRQVIDTISQFYSFGNANIHRGVYDLSNHATRDFEAVRKQTAQFLGSENATNVAFTKGTTESINIVARSFIQPRLQKGDNVVTTIMEHHANFLPWQVICEENEAELRVIPVNDQGDIDIGKLQQNLDKKSRILALNHISNTLGTANPIAEMIGLAHDLDIPVLIDAAQSAAYYDLDVQAFNYDFLAFSGHKLFGPFGVGVLFVADEFKDRIGPYNYGGGMIRQVSLEGSDFATFPNNMDAGTPNVAGVLGLGSAMNYVSNLDRKWTHDHLAHLTGYAEEKLNAIDNVSVLGAPKNRSGILSFNVQDIHPHDVASFLNKDQIAVRAGAHCTQPLLNHLEIPATVRVSFSIYNTADEIDRLEGALIDLIKFWT